MAKGIYKRTPEQIQRIKLLGKSNKGKPSSMGALGKSWKLSNETKLKMSSSKKGNKNYNFGKKTSLEIRKKISETHKNIDHSYLKGIKRSEQARKNISDGHKGEKAYNWMADRSMLKMDRLKMYDTKYKYWMLSVKKRDGFKCKINNLDCCGRLEAHHILRWAEHPELRYDINNGISLCAFHHPIKKEEEVRLAPLFKKLLC